MTQGRKPKPTAEKLAIGNPGNHPINTDEPQYDIASIDAPPSLFSHSKTYWETIVPPLVASNVLTVVDLPLMEVLCETYGRWKHINNRINKGDNYEAEYFPAVLERTQKGEEISSPLVKQHNDLVNLLLKITPHFGLSPSTRASIRGNGVTTRPKTQEEELLGFD